MKGIFKFIFVTTTLLAFFPCYAIKNIFYILRPDNGKILQTQHQKINTLIAQAYYINRYKVVAGNFNPSTLALAKQYHIKFIAMVTNAGYNPTVTHEFLASEKLQQNAIQDLLNKCQVNHLDGIQFDFEGMNVNDKDAYTAFIQHAADAFHHAHLEISIAVLPEVYKIPPTKFWKLYYDKWSGVFDLAALAKSCDYITLMAYNQHVDLTPPGPVAGFTWVKYVIENTLKVMPRAKLSLGIPTYSSYWRMRSINFCNDVSSLASEGVQIPYERVQELMKEFNIKLLWDNTDKVHYALFPKFFIYQYLFIEDARSLQAKLELVKQFKLNSISVFSIGSEDPAIWNHL